MFVLVFISSFFSLFCSKNSSVFNRIDTVTSFKSKSNPIKKFAAENGLECYRWPISTDVIKHSYDLGVVVSFGHLIPEEIIKAFPLQVEKFFLSLLLAHISVSFQRND